MKKNISMIILFFVTSYLVAADKGYAVGATVGIVESSSTATTGAAQNSNEQHGKITGFGSEIRIGGFVESQFISTGVLLRTDIGSDTVLISNYNLGITYTYNYSYSVISWMDVIPYFYLKFPSEFADITVSPFAGLEYDWLLWADIPTNLNEMMIRKYIDENKGRLNNWAIFLGSAFDYQLDSQISLRTAFRISKDIDASGKVGKLREHVPTSGYDAVAVRLEADFSIVYKL